MHKTITKFYTTKAKDEGDRTLTFVGSDESIDRDNEKILLSAWDLKNYKTNPVILLNHNSKDLPIAKTIKVWKSKEQLKFKVKFPEAEVSSLGDSVYKLCKSGYLSATSVGFRPSYKDIIWGDASKGEPAVTYQKVELLELSICSVGCNPRALLTNKSMKDAIKDNVIDELELNELASGLKEYDEEDITTKSTPKTSLDTPTINDNNKDNTIVEELKIATIKIKQLELELYDKQVDIELKDNIYNKLYDEFINEVDEKDTTIEEILKELK